MIELRHENRRSSLARAVAGFVVAAAVTLTASACATMESGGFTVNKDPTERAFDEIRPRAAFELRCDQSEIRLVVLGVDGMDPAQIGASGCGHRVVYVTTPSSGWVMNTESSRSED